MRAAPLVALWRRLTSLAQHWRRLVVVACVVFVVGIPAVPAGATTSLAVTGHLNHSGAVRADGAGVELSVTFTCATAVDLGVEVTVQQALPGRILTRAVGGGALHCAAGTGTYRLPAEVGQFLAFRTGDAVATLTGSCSSPRYLCTFESERVLSLRMLNLDKLTARARQDTVTLKTPGRIVHSGSSATIPITVACPYGRTSADLSGSVDVYQRTSKGAVQSAGGSPPDFVCDGRSHTVQVSVTPSRQALHVGYAFVVLDISDCSATTGTCASLTAWRQATLQ